MTKTGNTCLYFGYWLSQEVGMSTKKDRAKKGFSATYCSIYAEATFSLQGRLCGSYNWNSVLFSFHEVWRYGLDCNLNEVARLAAWKKVEF